MKKLPLIVLIALSLMYVVACSKEDHSNTNASGGSTARMTVNGDYLYIVATNQLYTYDISKPEQTVLLNAVSVGWSDVETIFPYRDKLFVGSGTGMFVFDISDPKTPKLQGQVQHFRACDPVVANNDYAYITLRNSNSACGAVAENSLNIYNIQGNNILNPALEGRLELPDPNGLGLSGDYLYVCCGNKGLYTINVSNAANPVITKTINTGETFIDVIPYDKTLIAYVNGGFILYDINDPANPIQLSVVNQ